MEISEETDLSFLCIDIYIPMWTNNNQLNHQPNSANQIISPNLKETKMTDVQTPDLSSALI